MSHQHGKPPAPSAAHDVQPDNVAAFEPYSLHGAAACKAARDAEKKRKREVGADEAPAPHDADPMDDHDPDAAEINALEGEDGSEDGVSEAPRKRQPAAQCTPDEIKEMRPLSGQRLGVGVYIDRKDHCRITATYPQERMNMHVSPESIASLPEELQPATRYFSIGKKPLSTNKRMH